MALRFFCLELCRFLLVQFLDIDLVAWRDAFSKIFRALTVESCNKEPFAGNYHKRVAYFLEALRVYSARVEKAVDEHCVVVERTRVNLALTMPFPCDAGKMFPCQQHLRHHLMFFKKAPCPNLDVKRCSCERNGKEVQPVHVLKESNAHLDLAQFACILLVRIKIRLFVADVDKAGIYLETPDNPLLIQRLSHCIVHPKHA